MIVKTAPQIGNNKNIIGDVDKIGLQNRTPNKMSVLKIDATIPVVIPIPAAIINIFNSYSLSLKRSPLNIYIIIITLTSDLYKI